MRKNINDERPKEYPVLKYKPSSYINDSSYYDKNKADRAMTFINSLKHTKGEWHGKRFWLLPWQEQIVRDLFGIVIVRDLFGIVIVRDLFGIVIVRDLFGIVKEDGKRQFRTAFVEICKKVGKSELAASIALILIVCRQRTSS